MEDYKRQHDLDDGLDIAHTKIHEDPKAQFVNATTYRGIGTHMAENLSYNDAGLRRLVNSHRDTAPAPEKQAEQGLQGP